MPIRPISTTEVEQFSSYGVNRVIKTIVFDDDTTTVPVFTLTGSVIVKVIAECMVDCESAAGCNAQLGITGDVGHCIADTDVTTLEVGDIWHDASPDSDIEAINVIEKDIIVGGADLFLTLDAQWDSGTVAFYCFWTPVSADGAVAAA